MILGTFPILLGLSLWQALAATVVGVLVGSLFLMPMGLFGPLTGTNNAVSSGAHFGVRGRVVGSFLSLLTAIAFYSISVWVSGDAVVGALIRLFGISDSDLLRGVVYAILGAMVIVVVVYGYVFMLLVNKVVVVGNTVMILLGVLAYSGQIDLSYNPGPDAYALGSFWPTFVLSALIVMGNPISFGAFLGDWTRYIPERTKPSSLMLATLAAQACTLVPFFFGVITATLVAGEADYIVALINASPLWYAVLLIGVAFLGGLSTGITSLYGTGLDFSSVFPRFSRVQASLFIGAFAFLFILVGRLAFDLIDSVNAFIGAIVICTTPWMVIMTLGYFVRRGHYSAADLQVFNLGLRGGPVLVRQRRQLARHGGLDPGGDRRTAVRQLPAADRGSVPQRCRRRGHQPAGGHRPGRRALPRHALPRPGAALRLRARGTAPGADAGRARRRRSSRTRTPRATARSSATARPRRKRSRSSPRGSRMSDSLPRIVEGDHVGQVDNTQVPRFAGPSTFAQLPRIDEVDSADIAVVGIPFDAGVSYRPGARFGPAHIRASSKLLRPYNPAVDLSPFALQQVADAGDIAANPFSLEEAVTGIERAARVAARARRPAARARR